MKRNGLARKPLLLGTSFAALATLLTKLAYSRFAYEQNSLPWSLRRDLVDANQILSHIGVLDAYGHVSVRDPHRADRFWMSSSKAPALVSAADITEYDLDCNPVHARGRRSYYEKWIHGEVYKVRPDVHAIIHSHSPTVIPFSATNADLQPLLQTAAFLTRGVPVYDNRRYLPDSDLMIGQQFLGREMAQTLGPDAAVVLLRGHGDVVVGPNLRTAVFRAYYTELNAKEQEQAIALGGRDVIYLNPGEGIAAERLTESPQSVDRSWTLWKSNLERDEDCSQAVICPQHAGECDALQHFNLQFGTGSWIGLVSKSVSLSRSASI